MTYTLKTRTTEDDWRAVETENPLSKRMKTAQRRVQQVLDGYARACYLSGGAGLGKTQAINAVTAGKTVIRAIPRDYHDLLFWFEQSRGTIPLIFEECDHLFRSERALNLLKMATDPNGPKVIRIRVQPKKKGELSTYKTIPLTAPLVFALNGDLNNHGNWPSACVPHILALASREHPITIDGDRVERWEYTMSLAVLHNLIRKTEDQKAFIPLAVQNDAIAWFTRNLWRLDEVSPRRLKKVAQTMMLHHSAGHRYGMQELQDDLEQFLSPNNSRGLAHPPVPTIFVTPYANFQGQSGTTPSQWAGKSASPNASVGPIPHNQLSDQMEGDLADLSDQELADLAEEALTELLRRNPIAKLLSWKADEATIKVQVAYRGADFKLLQRGPDPKFTAEQHALNALSHENW